MKNYEVKIKKEIDGWINIVASNKIKAIQKAKSLALENISNLSWKKEEIKFVKIQENINN